jgi:cytochrome c5
MSSPFKALFIFGFCSLLLGCNQAEDDRPRVVKLYQQSCISCHERGLANAPATGSERWQQLLDEKGMPTLLKHANDGFRGMPPRGGCFDCNPADYEALIRYMLDGTVTPPAGDAVAGDTP